MTFRFCRRTLATGVHHCIRRNVANHRADSLPRFQQSHRFQAANGVTDRAATDTEGLYQFTLGREHVARFEFVDDAGLQLPGDL